MDEELETREMACVRCSKKFEMETWDDHLVECMGPGGVVICKTTGCGGSTVYDALVGDPWLEFIICDPCFKKLRPGMQEGETPCPRNVAKTVSTATTAKVDNSSNDLELGEEPLPC